MDSALINSINKKINKPEEIKVEKEEIIIDNVDHVVVKYPRKKKKLTQKTLFVGV